VAIVGEDRMKKQRATWQPGAQRRWTIAVPALLLTAFLFTFPEALAADDAIKSQRNMVLLDEAERLISEGPHSEARTSITAVLNNTDNEKVIERGKLLLEKNQPTIFGKLGLSRATLLKIGSWWVDIVVGILILVLLYLVLRAMRYLWSLTQNKKWRLQTITDTSNTGVADLIVESLCNWGSDSATLTSGLLRLERLQLPSVNWLKPNSTTLDLSEVLKDFSLQVGGVSLKGLAGAGKGMKSWFHATCPAISGKASLQGANLLVSLTARSADGNVIAVTESRTKKSPAPAPGAGVPVMAGLDSAMTASSFPAEDIQSAAQSASYKMFYLISEKSNVLSHAEAADTLRQGLKQLWQHVSTQDPYQLEEAYNAFRAARTKRVDFYEAYLYEGIALDLLSQHDEAIKRFEYLEKEERHKDAGLREKAIYNKAISLFRKYQPAAAKQAEDTLERLINSIAEPYEESQIKAMALAAKASVIAQGPMYKTNPADDGESTAAPVIKTISEIKDQLDTILNKVKENGKWNRGDELQLEWAINNAWGSVHLYSAIYTCGAPAVPRTKKDEDRRHKYLMIAYDAFQTCALLLTPGVENLTSLAKVALELDWFAQGRSYLDKVINMNPCYEYAYYRLAIEWDKRKDTAKVVQVLQSYLNKKGTPHIPAFEALLQKYQTALNGSKS